LDRFDALISKIIFKKLKKYHFDAFRHEKHFEKQPQTAFIGKLFQCLIVMKCLTLYEIERLD
jgi:hypothetical protein